ncbi:RidA family protein [Altererythrobacter arenosus]|uniref:RidA family protein n=1 Tax=Altererythrobacter arenosus TaxID=3032592 RepID=A0ABY8FMJ5_9SPHN|nr:RidA family protein [Altererythrobacter sp. CAU 1644]WFL76245.1 RidA family protein [Altererythrobacter sp. CAU 1644]
MIESKTFIRFCAAALAAGLTVSAAAHDKGPVFTPSPLPYPFSDAVQVGDLLIFAGDIGMAEDGQTVEPGGIEPETRRIMIRLGERLAAHGLDYKDVVKCTVMLTDMSEWPAFNAIYAEYFAKPYPARSAFGANGLALGARVELECWAYKQAA